MGKSRPTITVRTNPNNPSETITVPDIFKVIGAKPGSYLTVDSPAVKATGKTGYFVPYLPNPPQTIDDVTITNTSPSPSNGGGSTGTNQTSTDSQIDELMKLYGTMFGTLSPSGSSMLLPADAGVMPGSVSAKSGGGPASGSGAGLILLLALLGVGGYFAWKKFKK